MIKLAGADTIVSAVLSMFLAMCLNPEVQDKAQKQLDNVTGGRLPIYSDRPQLPYIVSSCLVLRFACRVSHQVFMYCRTAYVMR